MAPASAASSNVGGMQRAARDLLNQLQSQGDLQVTPLVLACSARKLWRKAPLYFIGLPWRLLHAVWIQRHGVIVFASLNPAIWLAVVAPLLRRRGVRLVAISHGLDITQGPPIWQWLVRRTLGQLDGVIAVSRATQEQCLKRGFPAERLQVLPNGISPRLTMPARAERCEWEKGEGIFLCLAVGRQIPRKGLAWFVDQVMPLLPAHIHLWLVGGGPQAPVIREAIDRQGLQGRVRQLGVISDAALAAVYEQADLFVMPNLKVNQDMEGFGIVMLEAGLSGLFSLASAIEGITDVISSANGRLLPPRAAEAFAAAIEEQAALPQAIRSQQSQQARAWVEQHFGWGPLLPRYRAALETVQAKPARWER